MILKLLDIKQFLLLFRLIKFIKTICLEISKRCKYKIFENIFLLLI